MHLGAKNRKVNATTSAVLSDNSCTQPMTRNAQNKLTGLADSVGTHWRRNVLTRSTAIVRIADRLVASDLQGHLRSVIFM